MSPRYKRRAQIGIGSGILAYVGAFMAAQHIREILSFRLVPPVMIGISLIATMLVAVALFLWGCRSYAMAKGLNPIWGYVGLLHIVGLLILFLLRDRHPERLEDLQRGFEVLAGDANNDSSTCPKVTAD